jgi:hypothetical protein
MHPVLRHIITPLKRLRRRMHLIRYYSASKAHDAWSRAFDAAVLITLPLALLCTCVMDRVVQRVEPVDSRSGVLFRTTDGPIGAKLDVEGMRRATPTGTHWFGEFTLHADRADNGWPFRTSSVMLSPKLRLNLYDTAAVDEDAQLAADDPTRAAIVSTMTQEGPTPLLDRWQATNASGPRDVSYWGWFFATALYWIALMMCSLVILRISRVLWVVQHRRAHRKRRAHLQQNRCPACGYDLRGLEFHERCPECGELT